MDLHLNENRAAIFSPIRLNFDAYLSSVDIVIYGEVLPGKLPTWLNAMVLSLS